MSRFVRWVRHAALVAGAVLLASCIPGNLPINIAPGAQAIYVVAGANHPAAIAFAPDGRVFYTEKNTGRVRIVEDGALREQPFADVPVNYAGDRGLLGIALHPLYNLNSRVYVFYSRSDTGDDTDDPRAIVDHRVVYFVDNENLAGGEVFVAAFKAEGNGNRVGGQLAFLEDRTLLVALGDQTNVDAPQDPNHLSGKILRYTDSGAAPADNPIADWPLYARGFRDPRGLTVEPDTQAVIMTDRSADRYHEINLVNVNGNYGWPIVNGLADTTAELAFAAEHENYIDPLLDSGRATSPFIGGDFNPNTKYGRNERARYFYGVRDTGRMVSLDMTAERDGVLTINDFGNAFPTPITDVAFKSGGTLYVTTESALLRVDPFP